MDYFILIMGLVLGLGLGYLVAILYQHKSELLYTLTTLKEDIVQFNIKLDKLLTRS